MAKTSKGNFMEGVLPSGAIAGFALAIIARGLYAIISILTVANGKPTTLTGHPLGIIGEIVGVMFGGALLAYCVFHIIRAAILDASHTSE